MTIIIVTTNTTISIIGTVVDRGYVLRQRKELVPTFTAYPEGATTPATTFTSTTTPSTGAVRVARASACWALVRATVALSTDAWSAAICSALAGATFAS